MNQRLSIYTRSQSLNTYGERSSTYTLSGYVWGRVKHKIGKEPLTSSKMQADSNIQITSRTFSGTEGDEIEYNGYRWEVEGVRRKHRQNNITIIANRLHAAISYYLQPDGTSLYTSPTGDDYIQP